MCCRKQLHSNNTESVSLDSKHVNLIVENIFLQVEKQIMVSRNPPNFLAPRPDLKEIYGIGDLSTPQVRLSCSTFYRKNEAVLPWPVLSFSILVFFSLD